jgi:pimeloyl-ACP methyl ester carboxylesterase
MGDAHYEQLPTGHEGERIALRCDAPPGGGPCLLYLHGFGSTQDGEKAAHFRRRAAATGIPFASLDFRGHGRSGGVLADLTMSRNLEDVGVAAEHLRRRGYECLVLMGSSMGGAAGLWYAALHPQEVVCGVHLAPALELGPSLEAWAGPEGLRRWQLVGSIPFANELVSCDLGWALVEDLRRYGADRLAALARTPALLLQGQQDDRVGWRAVADFAAASAAAGVELHLFADGDHRLLPYKERLWELAVGFLRARGALPAG